MSSFEPAAWWRCLHCGHDKYEEHVFTGRMKGVPMIHCENCKILHSHPDPNSPRALRWQISELTSALEYLLAAATAVNDDNHCVVDPDAIRTAIEVLGASAASGMEARRAAAENTDAVHDSPTAEKRGRPNPIGDIPQDV